MTNSQATTAAGAARVAPEAHSVVALPGSAFPLGATPGEHLGIAGTNFAIASSVANSVTLCLFDAAGTETQIPVADNDAGIWHAFVPGIGPGQSYGYRVGGPWDPARGLRCNPAKLLLDPYAKAISGTVTFGPEVLGQDATDPARPSTLDSAGHVPRSLVADPAFSWQDGQRPWHRYADTVVYEVHVKGFTMRHPDIPAAAAGDLRRAGPRGRHRAPGRPGRHRRRAAAGPPERAGGVPGRAGADELLGLQHDRLPRPAQRVLRRRPGGPPGRSGRRVQDDGGRAAPGRPGSDPGRGVQPHRRSRPDGPALCFRGIDNLAYYRTEPGDPGAYYDTTGCGNSLNAGDPITLQLMMDSLRYWLTEMHADGFRFDLAPTLARQDGGYSKVSAFLDMCSQDPVVCQAKLVAEPWDVGQMDSYDLGRFPPLWREWNGKYRDTMRDFWRSHPVGIGEFADRFAGSADLYATAGRRPTASVNLITVHDGFTLADLVSYDDKHNEANGEDNRDGTSDNNSWNCGAEGPTDDPGILALRARQSRAMLTTLLLSFGVPMLLGGDEMGRTQQGNNNAYCQDNEIAWFDWSQPDTELQDYTRRLIALRTAHPVFRRRRFLSGAEASELQWFTPAGSQMTAADWSDQNALAIALYLDGSDDPDRAEDGTWLLDDDFFVLVNAWWEPLDFVLPATRCRGGLAGRAGQLRPDPGGQPAASRVTASPSAPAPLSCSPQAGEPWSSGQPAGLSQRSPCQLPARPMRTRRGARRNRHWPALRRRTSRTCTPKVSSLASSPCSAATSASSP